MAGFVPAIHVWAAIWRPRFPAGAIHGSICRVLFWGLWGTMVCRVGRTTLGAAVGYLLLVTVCYAQAPASTKGDVTATMARLAIELPQNVAASAAVSSPLQELGRERCDQDAILQLGNALQQAGY
jgi:hypothetical protein